jgi:hypothetical protein
VSEEPSSDKTKALRKATRRARWAYEDAERAEAEGAGESEGVTDRMKRLSERSAEVAREGPTEGESPPSPPESSADKVNRLRDEDEIARELGDK